ncbi:2-oxo acid dehydrogenase subunit E2 [bacterium]|nr:2-oxo acid dehydrogenase subunit E2 [bacterium]MBU1984392.1 2-oxo acid dehydrogenase subunit E2 [bacterium]
MVFVFKFPDIGEGIHEGKILEWYVSKSQTVKEGDPLVKVETDKVVADIPSPRTGVVKNLFGKVGQVINVGNVLAELEVEGKGDEIELARGKPAPSRPHVEGVEETGFGVVGQIEVAHDDAFLPATGEGIEEGRTVVSGERRKVLASPVARRMAKDLGVDIATIRGTGPGGRVMKEDVRLAAESQRRATIPAKSEMSPIAPPSRATSPVERVEYEGLSQLRKTIIARMVESKFTAPHMTAHEEVEISKLVELRREQKSAMVERGVNLSYLPFIIRAVALSLKKHRKLNCRLDLENNRVIYRNYFNIGIAVDTSDGLIVPVIKDADQRSIIELAQIIGDLAARARERKLTLNEIRDGTFSITNYGSLAGTYGAPIINYPEVAILGVGRIMEKPVVRNGQIVPGHVLPLSLSADHRIVDGGDVSRFLLDLMVYLSDPANMLLE